MKLENITQEDAKFYLDKVTKQINNKSPEQIFMKYLVESGVKKFSTPYNISWEITAGCNLRCKHCCFAGQDYDEKNDVTTQQAVDFAYQLLDGDLARIMITGGEPLLRKDLFEIIEIFKTKNVVIELTSNATLINEQVAQKLGELFNPLSDFVQVSLDGADAETHDKTRGKGSFEKTLNGIKLLIKNGVKVTINCVVTTLNIHQMCELYDLAQNLGAKSITFSKIYADEDKSLVPDNNLLFAETIKLLRKENEKLFINLRLFSFPEIASNDIFKKVYNQPLKKISDFICHRNEKLHIRKDGEVFLCLYSSTKDAFPLGNIKKDTLEKILLRSEQNPLFQERIIENEKCNGCHFQFYCKAGCPVNAFLKKGTTNTFDPICLK